MKFYRATVRYEEIYFDRRKTLSKICLDLNNEFWDDKSDICVVVSHITCHCMEIISAVKNPCIQEIEIKNKIELYVSELQERTTIPNIEDCKIEKLKEITLNTFCDLLDEYSIDTLLDDKDKIRNLLGVNAGCFLYKEELLDQDEVNKNLNNGYLFDKDEKKRIKCGHKLNFPSVAPIHYVIYEDDEDIRDSVCKELIGYLWRKGRICNRRIVTIDDKDTLMNSLRKKVYNLNSLDGGVVILKLDSNADEAKRYFNLVSEDKNNTYSDKFTIVVLSNASDMDGYNKAIKDCFYSMAFYPIVNQRLDVKKAKIYFEELINNDGLKPETDSWKKLLVKDEYTYFEIGKIYKKWSRNSYYVERNFTQYKEIVEDYFFEKDENIVDAKQELEELIGLESVKNLIKEIVDYHKLTKIRKDMNIVDSASSMHMVFMGNPGTAKTTVARIIARILKEEGVLKKGDLIEVGRADLVGKYVGWTAKNIQDYFKKARGSVLFIDEAYSLLDGQNSFGDEAINTIVQEMENMRDEVVVIMAGYKKDMYEFINKNSGMRSRIKFFVDFPDYTIEEMYKILQHLARSEKMTINLGVEKIFSKVICKPEYKGGNGRSVRNIYEKSKMKQARRLMALKESDAKKMINVLEEVDFCEL